MRDIDPTRKHHIEVVRCITLAVEVLARAYGPMCPEGLQRREFRGLDRRQLTTTAALAAGLFHRCDQVCQALTYARRTEQSRTLLRSHGCDRGAWTWSEPPSPAASTSGGAPAPGSGRRFPQFDPRRHSKD